MTQEADEVRDFLNAAQVHLDRALTSLAHVMSTIEDAKQALTNAGAEELAWKAGQLHTSQHEPYLMVIETLYSDIENLKWRL